MSSVTAIKKVPQNESLALWKVKLQLASQGSYQAIQQVKEHILEQTDQDHPIFKQSFYDILQQGFEVVLLDLGTVWKSFETFRDLPLMFLISGQVSVRCINLDGDNEIVSTTKTKGLITVQQPTLSKKYGQENLNLLTKFQLVPAEPSIILVIEGSNKLLQILKRKQITEKQNNVMRRFMIFPSKEIVRVTVNPTNQEHINDRLYLLAGRACFYVEDQRIFGRKVILACYEEGYLNPKEFCASQQNSNIPSSFKIQEKPKQDSSKQKKPTIKLYIFENSELMYLEQNFLKDDLVKAIQLKRQKHIQDILDRYHLIRQNLQAIEAAQNQLIARFKLNKKQINSHIHKIVEAKKDKGFMTAKQTSNQKKLKTRTDLISTSSSMKCSIRIRKSKKIV